MLCALTGELIYEPTHPWLEQVRCHLLKKWTWINKGIYLPTALTLFYLQFEVEQQPIDDFQCLGDLTLGRPLDIQCFVKAPQRPGIRHRKCLEDAIEQLQGQRLWSLLNRYQPPSLLRDQRGNQMYRRLFPHAFPSPHSIRLGRPFGPDGARFRRPKRGEERGEGHGNGTEATRERRVRRK